MRSPLARSIQFSHRGRPLRRCYVVAGTEIVGGDLTRGDLVKIDDLRPGQQIRIATTHRYYSDPLSRGGQPWDSPQEVEGDENVLVEAYLPGIFRGSVCTIQGKAGTI
jgi:hypothetical protein